MHVCVHVYLHADHEAILFSKLSDIWPGSDPKRLEWRSPVWGGMVDIGVRVVGVGTRVNCRDRYCERTYNDFWQKVLFFFFYQKERGVGG